MAPPKKRNAAVFSGTLHSSDESSDGEMIVSVDRPSADGRRLRNATSTAIPPSPVKRVRKARRKAPEPSAGWEGEPDFSSAFEMNFPADPPPPSADAQDGIVIWAVAEEKWRRRKYITSDEPLKAWTPSRDEYLAEFMRKEGLDGVDPELCAVCGEACDEVFQCQTCIGKDLCCQSCCISTHQRHPFDVIKRWTNHFEDTTLQEIGLVIQLGHKIGETCANPRVGDPRFVIIHTTGIHEVTIQYCACHHRSSAGSYRDQLLRRNLYPATQAEPRTCATFEVCQQFHMLTLQSKTTTYDYYTSLERLTDNTGIRRLPDRYKSFLLIMRQWRHLKMLKRAGRGNDPIRKVAETLSGELAVLCPACPHPDVNLPKDWDKAAPDVRALYIMFIAVDACFRLKRLAKSSEKKDPQLGDGWSYYSKIQDFYKFLKTVTDQKDMSSCAGFNTMDLANSKYSKGYAETGTALGVCARHEFVLRTAVCDLQKGERFANMDWLAVNLITFLHPLLELMWSYDIACQWFIHLAERLRKFPPAYRIELTLWVIRYVIPKLHIGGHLLFCRLFFSLNYMFGAARTDGEGIERGWANIGPVATSTREMGPGHRRDTLEDHWGHWNITKLFGLGRLLKKRLLRAIPERNAQLAAFEEFSVAQAANVPQWKKMVDDFDADPGNPCPYEMPKVKTMTQAEVRKGFAEQDKKETDAGQAFANDVSARGFMLQALDLEHQQMRLRIELEMSKKPETAFQITDLLERRTKLSRNLNKHRTLQTSYQPGASKYQSEVDEAAPSSEPSPTEDLCLTLPSDIPAGLRAGACASGLADLELSMRLRQLQWSLDDLRMQLTVKSRMLTARASHVRHQRASTRAQVLVRRNEIKIAQWAAQYQRARAAAIALLEGSPNQLDDKWKELEKKHIRLLDDGDAPLVKERNRRGLPREAVEENGAQKKGEGYKEAPSWIWQGVDAGDSAYLENGLRVEWCKLYARQRRWSEEVRLLREEMRRTVVFLRVMCGRWKERGDDEQGAEGARAYGHRQSKVCADLANHFSGLWLGLGTEEGGDVQYDEPDVADDALEGEVEVEEIGYEQDEEGAAEAELEGGGLD